ncbi:MAG: hypothetical protein D6742_16180 [Cyanobacteria bacterium J069]|nr:MAG: hypothetical protein D6742_16180 [Cyanobacteria bacterium J069]
MVYTLPRREYGFVRMRVCHFLCWLFRKDAEMTSPVFTKPRILRNSKRIEQTMDGVAGYQSQKTK